MSLTSLKPYCDSILVLDTETSGLSFSGDEIIEFSAVKLCWNGEEAVVAAETD